MIPSWPSLLPFLLLGLLGSLHCAGMCGGFALAAAGAHQAGWRSFALRQTVYILGKAASYACVAMLLALAGSRLGLGPPASPPTEGAGFSRAPGIVTILAGVVLIAMGAAHLGLKSLQRLRQLRPPGRWTALLRPVFDGVRALPGPSAAFGTGVLNGLLPCGLSWSAFVLASRESPATAGTGALLFGLATGPVLVGVALAPRALSLATRERLEPLIGIALLLFGSITLFRGAAKLDPDQTHESCCSTATAQLARPAQFPRKEAQEPCLESVST